MKNKFYITTAIPYVNSIPHIGFALEIVQADVLARYYRQKGNEVMFVTGSDENSFKIARTAISNNITPQELVNKNSLSFRDLKQILNISFDDFIRTTEIRHVEGAKKLWGNFNKDDIYLDTWKGRYCVGCDAHYKKEELIDGKICPEHLTEVEYTEETNYFFKISRYKEIIHDLIKSDTLEVIPGNRKEEILNTLSEFHDFNISRQKKYDWGIEVPGNNQQIIYPWVDALTNYINAVGYYDDQDKFNYWWVDAETKIIHIIGKGITKFHAIYWPAMLLSAGIRLPNKILVHGYLTIAGQKISKTIGNVVSPITVTTKYGIDAVRYFLLREISSWGDGDFSEQKLIDRYNGDLANGLGNLVSRVATLIENNLSDGISYDSKLIEQNTKNAIQNTFAKYQNGIENFKLHEALIAIWELIAQADKYVNDNKPWALVKEDAEKFKVVMINLVEMIYQITKSIAPFMPETADKISAVFDFKKEEASLEGRQLLIKKGAVLFPRL